MNSEQSLALQNLQALARISELERVNQGLRAQLDQREAELEASVDVLGKIATLANNRDLMTARDIALSELKRQDRL